MVFPGVSLLKFVGTVSLGLLTGLSYTLSTVTLPTLLTLPSASSASRAFRTLVTSSKRQLRSLTFISAASFTLAYVFSPRNFRHPYLLYTAVLALSSATFSTEELAARFYLPPKPGRPAVSPAAAAAAAARREHAVRARMEASYEVLGAGSDSHSDEGIGSASGDEDDSAAATTPAQVNGEEVRGEVDGFIKKQLVRTGIAGFGFFVAVLGIWGDGAARAAVYSYY